jgi:hypothetical protein
MTALRVLKMSNCFQQTITDGGFAALAQSRTLEALDMRSCWQRTITDGTLAALGRMSALRVLNMRFCAHRTITDAGFAALARSQLLEELDISHCEQATITDTALAHLSRCATLTALNVGKCNQRAWSAVGARSLASSRSLRSEHREYAAVRAGGAAGRERVTVRTLADAALGRELHEVGARERSAAARTALAPHHCRDAPVEGRRYRICYGGYRARVAGGMGGTSGCGERETRDRARARWLRAAADFFSFVI